MGVDQLSPGTVFAQDYEILRPLAQGGMGAVYVARQRSTGKERALKVLLPEAVTNPRNREAFAQEARAGALIESPHVVEVVGAGVDEATGAPWLAMEFLKGETLADRVARQGPLSVTEAAALFEQLGDALGCAHAVGVVHRDLKPENVFVVPSSLKGVPFMVKVLDFGIAKFIAADRTSATATRAIGSPMWLAPEQAEADAQLRPATDVWALGLLAFWCLTGRSFWKSANASEVSITGLLMEIAVSPIPPASARAAELGIAVSLPPSFDAWFSRCVARAPSARYPEASAASRALLDLLTAPQPAVTPMPRTEVMPAVQSPLASTVAMPALPLGGPSAIPVLGMPPQRPRAPQPSPPSGGSQADRVVPAVLGVALLLAGGVWLAQRPAPRANAASADASVEAPERRLPSGVVYRALREGTGAHPTATDRVTVHYRGTLRDGTEFDSSYTRGAPATFPLHGVIRCWTEGLQEMAVGGRAQLECPPDTAYGETGRPPVIPGGATLRFEVELLGIDAP